MVTGLPVEQRSARSAEEIKSHKQSSSVLGHTFNFGSGALILWLVARKWPLGFELYAGKGDAAHRNLQSSSSLAQRRHFSRSIVKPSARTLPPCTRRQKLPCRTSHTSPASASSTSSSFSSPSASVRALVCPVGAPMSAVHACLPARRLPPPLHRLPPRVLDCDLRFAAALGAHAALGAAPQR